MTKLNPKPIDVLFTYAVVGMMLVCVNLIYCVEYGDCMIDDKRHTHGKR